MAVGKFIDDLAPQVPVHEDAVTEDDGIALSRFFVHHGARGEVGPLPLMHQQTVSRLLTTGGWAWRERPASGEVF